MTSVNALQLFQFVRDQAPHIVFMRVYVAPDTRNGKQISKDGLMHLPNTLGRKKIPSSRRGQQSELHSL
jgi:hypothetical protein